MLYVMPVDYAGLIDAIMNELKRQFPDDDILEAIKQTVDIFDGKGVDKEHLVKTRTGYLALAGSIPTIETYLTLK